jgi:hypothetical protein
LFFFVHLTNLLRSVDAKVIITNLLLILTSISTYLIYLKISQKSINVKVSAF